MNLSERTFAGRGRIMFHDVAKRATEKEFLLVGDDLILSEELTNKLYEFYLALITTGWVGTKGLGSVADVGEAYRNGFYYPCVERVVLTGQVDLVNDYLPEYAGLVITDVEGEHHFASMRQVKLLYGFAAPIAGTTYIGTWFYRGHVDRADRKKVGADAMKTTSFPFVVSKLNGKILPCRWLQRGEDATNRVASIGAAFAVDAAATINAWSDRRHLWNVETEEPIISRMATPFRLGVSEEHVKSLFYAREAPLTESGRKRPILHWVRAHQRRLKAGVDIDVRKHMRGIIEFEMDGFPFRITSPVKTLS
jgi:hypothetical protein